MKKTFKLSLYLMLSALSLNVMATTLTTIPEKEQNLHQKDRVIYKLNENGISIIGKLKPNVYKEGSEVKLYVFKNSVKVYNKYTTMLENNSFSFENLVSNKSPEYIKHYQGSYFYKIVVDSDKGDNFNTTYKITNNKYTRMKIDQSKGINYPTPENSVEVAYKSKKGLQKKKSKSSSDPFVEPKFNEPVRTNVKTTQIPQNTVNKPVKIASTKVNNNQRKNTSSVNINSSELNGYIDQLNIMFKRYEKEYINEQDKYMVSNNFKAELTSIFKSNNRVPNNLCKQVTKSFAKSVYKLTKKLKNNDIGDASSVLKDIRRFRICK